MHGYTISSRFVRYINMKSNSSKYVLAVILPMIVGELFVSCKHGNSEVAASLDRIEMVVEQHPDSALFELNRIDSLLDAGAVRIEGDRQMARYALLKTQTHDKNWIDDTNDSLILSAVRYYDDHGCKRQQMLAHFYHGAIFRNAKDYGAAFVAYRQAESLAKEINDNYYLTRIYGNLFSLSYETYSKDAIMYAQENLKYARKIGDAREAILAKADMAKYYFVRLKYDSAELLCHEVMDSLPATDPIVQSCLTFYIEQCMTTEQYILADSLIGLLRKPIYKPVDLMNNACLFQIKGHKDSADTYINLAKQSIKTPEQWVYFYEKSSWIAKKRGNYEEAFDMKHNRFEVENDVITSIFSKSVSDYQRDFESMQKNQAEYRYAEYKSRSTFVAVICILIVGVLFAVFYKLFKRRSLLLDEAITRNVEQCILLENQETTVSELKSQIESLQQNLMTAKSATISSKLSKLLVKRFKFLDRIGILFFSKQKEYGLERTIYNAIHKELKNLQSGNKTIKEIDQLIDDYTEGAMTKAKNKEMKLSDDEVELLRYMLMNLSNDTILYLLDFDNRLALYKRKDRLKQKIKTSECKFAKEIFAYLQHKTATK